jgi:DNA polymerase II large subunit
MVEYSKTMQEYFDNMKSSILKLYDVAQEARKKGFDPEEFVEIPMVENMAERVEGLISVVAPQIQNSGVSERIKELENEYSSLDWRVAFKIGLEVTKEKFCKFKDIKEALEIGIRTGFAYLTMGIVASPLEGFVELELKKTREGKEYFAIRYAGPIRSAGGTGASVSVLLADYIRKNMGYAAYDPEEKEVRRYVTELYDYHDRITNLQYLPSEEEIEFMAKHLPVELDGDGAAGVEVSNYKDLDRVNTNGIRSGVCLAMGEGLCQKSEKLWKQLSKWGHEFGMEHWDFMGEFVKLKKKMHAKGAGKKTSDSEEKEINKPKILPDTTFIKDLVGGRPIFTHPMRPGGFRLRYGRSRTSGFSSYSIHPSIMWVCDDFIAIGTQLKNERPGKGCTVTVCDSIEPPIVKLKNGNVLILHDIHKAKEITKQVDEILFMGDILINYGDFFNRAHTLAPPGYCPEWWVLELEKKVTEKLGNKEIKKISEYLEIEEKLIEKIIKDPLLTKINAQTAIKISEKLEIPLHPDYTFHWNLIDKEKLKYLMIKMLAVNIIHDEQANVEKIVFKNDKKIKLILENIGIPHIMSSTEFIVIEKNYSKTIEYMFNVKKLEEKKIDSFFEENKDFNGEIVELINKFSRIKIRDKSGLFIGARMGRPEKSKQRKLLGSPHVLFPVGEEGGRMKCFGSALKNCKIVSDFPLFYCKKCRKKSVYINCEVCHTKCDQMYYCRECEPKINFKEKCVHGDKRTYAREEIDVQHYFDSALKHLNIKVYPDLIKGIKATANKLHLPENLAKGVLRAKHKIFVNKDGTTRYDMTQMPITHFKPIEIGTSIEKLNEMGYREDIYGEKLVDPEQICELKVQDLILPSNKGCIDLGNDVVLKNIGNFIDDLLVNFYKMKPFYNFTDLNSMVGHIVLVLAPHTSGGIAGRIVGFSDTQGLFAHPLLHAATRRDCLSKDTIISVFDNDTQKWENVEIGKLVERLNPEEEIDNYGTKIKKVDNYYMHALNEKTKKIELVKVKEFSKHERSKIIEFILEGNYKIKTTLDHKVFVKGFGMKPADKLKLGDQLVLPFNFDVDVYDVEYIDLLELYKKNKKIMGRGVKKKFEQFVVKNNGRKKTREILNLSKNQLDNYLLRGSCPLNICEKINLVPEEIGYIRNKISIPSKIKLNKELLYLIGIYLAEGFARKKTNDKGYYQISIAATEEQIRNKILKYMKNVFGLNPTENHIDHLTYSSRILYELFVDYLKLGNNAKNKSISNIFLNLPKNKIKYILQGYFDGDGSVSKNDLRVTCDSVSSKLLFDIAFLMKRFGIFVKYNEYEKEPGNIVKQFYIKKERAIPKFKNTKLLITSKYVIKFYENIGFSLKRKQKILENNLKKIKYKFNKIESDDDFAYPKIIEIKHLNKEEETYCLNLKHHNFIANNLLIKNCDGDEACIVLLLDVLLNFSRHFLPAHRGSTQDAPLVLTWKLIPGEVDDMAFDIDIVWKYPIEFYEACLEYKKPWDVQIDKIGDYLFKPKEYEGMGFTHSISNFNHGVISSAYKTLPTMSDKINGQMELGRKIRAVDTSDVARLVIEKHFLKDIKGNLRKFSMQKFRCVDCNEKYRRPPLNGKCSACKTGKVIFTISEGSIIKYLIPSIDLSKKYHLPVYLRQTLDILKRRVEGMFGKDTEKQEHLNKWFSE